MSVYDDMIAQSQRRQNTYAGQAAGSRTAYQSAITGFDPRAYMQSAASSAYDNATKDFNSQRTQQSVGLARRGFLGANLGGGAMDRNFATSLANTMGGLSLQTAGLEQNRENQLGNLYESDNQNQDQAYQDTNDLTMAQQQQKASDKASKRGMWGKIAGSVAGLAGTVLGGPIGGALAGYITKKATG